MSPWLRDPNLAVAALLAGILIGSVEFLRPGWVLPGVTGGTLIMLGIAGLSTQSLQPFGLLLLLTAIALMLADAMGHWNGWGVGLAASLAVVAVRILVSTRVSWTVALLGGLTLLATWRILQFAVQAKANKALSVIQTVD
ncbi:MAG: hypothetical protein HY820_40185 [Acidobacteria bacterium]|nr:hypothetical protein [Acidobacteriota bacterium]